LDIAQVKALVSLEQVLARYGVLERLRRSGRQLQGRCPIHRGSNSRQFTVDLRKGLWRCFGDCDRGGEAIAFVAAMEGSDAAGAASLMADWFGLAQPSPTTERRSAMAKKPTQPKHKVYAVEDREREDEKEPFWTRIGSAFPHKDGKGLNIVLSALPLNGRLVLREIEEGEEPESGDNKKRR
jgi:hypothetical protein